jgi:hypothetical protein
VGPLAVSVLQRSERGGLFRPCPRVEFALREHGQRNELTKLRGTGFGRRYKVEGPLTAPDGRRPRVCTVWQLDEGETAPRLITACPLERDE